MLEQPARRGGEVEAGREFPFSTEDFDQVRRLIHDHAGISLSPGKQEMVYSRLARRLRANGLSRFSDYLALLHDRSGVEWEAFTNALTTNLTAFFREPHHFPMLAERVRSVPAHRPVRLWCAASSTGEEPWSMAMTCVEALGSFTPRIEILASDLDTNVLARAEQGVYAAERIDKLSETRKRRFLVEEPATGQMRIRSELRALVGFRRINLLDSRYPACGPFDAIFCRNVMIYFDKPTQYRILQRFVPLLRPDGLLFAGHSENFYHAADLFRLRGRTVYELADPSRGWCGA
jgi:chemotaxis protein methyltransferase CheR